MKQITSIHNQLVKDLLKLQEKSSVRKKEGRFIVEGIKELLLAIKGGYQLNSLLFCPQIISHDDLKSTFNIDDTLVEVIEISLEVYQKLAYRSSTEGVIAQVNSRNHQLSELKLSTKNPLILVAEAPEKPGNIGALLRTADAAKLDAVIIANPKTDMYNPNIIRSSVGTVFTNQIATANTTEIINYLLNRSINIYCAELEASVPYDTLDYTESAALVVGTEATGLSDEWLKNSTKNIIIPMSGEIDSLNVSVSAAILIFEAKRQRKFK